MKLLHIDSSVLGDASVSRRLTRLIVDRWLARHPGTEVEYLDLAVDTPNHLNADALGFRLGPDAQGLSAAQQRENAVSERLVSQFLAADVVVLGAPMYNFGIASQLKAWFDRVAQAGRTFRYTASGPQGLAGGKTVIVASSRGGLYGAGSPLAAMDHQETYVEIVLRFFGITDLRVLRAEGLNLGDTVKAQSVAEAEAAVDAVVAGERVGRQVAALGA